MKRGDVFHREGEYWTIVYEGKLVRLRDAKGMRYLAWLLGRPGAKLDVRSLASGDGNAVGSPAEDAERARLAVTKRIKAAIRKITENHPSLGDHLAASVRTGRHCTYVPYPARRASWRVRSISSDGDEDGS